MSSEKVGSQTMLAQIVNMVVQAQRSKAPMQGMADKIAGNFVVVVVLIAITTFFTWGFWGHNRLAVWFTECGCCINNCLSLCIRLGNTDVNYGSDW